MSKQKVIVLAVRDQGMTVTAAARRYGVSRRWVHELLRREAEGGIDAVEPRPKRPLNNPRRTTGAATARILSLRRELAAAGLDAGPVTIASVVSQRRSCSATGIDAQADRGSGSCACRPETSRGDHHFSRLLTTSRFTVDDHLQRVA